MALLQHIHQTDLEAIMQRLRLCVLGGTGFVGRHLLNALARDGHSLRVLTRRRERHRDLLVLPTLELVETDIHYVSDLSTYFKDCNAVINLTGILNQGTGEKDRFQAVHAELPGKVLEACRFNGISRLLHMSALNADPGGLSAYLRSKGEGEAKVMEAARSGMQVTVFRPSVIFGPDDDFFNRFARLLRWTPVLPLACPQTRFAPVYVEDVARAFVKSLTDKHTIGKRYDLCGPDEYTLKELVSYTARVMGRRRLVFGLGDGLSRLQARFMEYLPGKPFTWDNYLSMQVDSVCQRNGLQDLDTIPTGLGAVVPRYLGNRNRLALYGHLRELARR